MNREEMKARTKAYANRIVKLHVIKEADEILAIVVSSAKTARTSRGAQIVNRKW